ncbi:hypothetical protein CACET_c04760 [Clostridium aceticum]|uniref:Uncharacterized protein n=1 Tax=Clostridium aceticum TaxID=84022 RepID=A0A0D8IHI2_9CLOT|nr:hypothetical protein [Clostridium aceticum]AKL93986.1 hypothetical protein CACET_c04760 [Clostridium aceticum]KJF28631.1 hypothetical protein TZ02_01615 [Clostridium aceticum]
MKKRLLAIAGIAIIAAISIVGYTSAEETNFTRPMNTRRGYLTREGITEGSFNKHYRNSGDMMQIMRGNGFEDMAVWMEDGIKSSLGIDILME